MDSHRQRPLGIAACCRRRPARLADGELNIYNWGNYTSPELIKKFEETYKVKVTVTDYDSNDTALAKVQAGGHGFDIVVPSASFVPIWIKEGLRSGDATRTRWRISRTWTRNGSMFHFDPGRHYSVPWQWGTDRRDRQHQGLSRATPTPRRSSSIRRTSSKARSTSCRR